MTLVYIILIFCSILVRCRVEAKIPSNRCFSDLLKPFYNNFSSIYHAVHFLHLLFSDFALKRKYRLDFGKYAF